MTPMIDVVFQLLIFFILSLKITTSEGDFSLRLPQNTPRKGIEELDSATFRLRMTAQRDGSLAAMRLDQRTLAAHVDGAEATAAAYRELHREVLARLGDARGPGSVAARAEVEIDCDYELDYEHVIAAITAVSGYVADDGDTIVTLVDTIRFSPPRKTEG